MHSKKEESMKRAIVFTLFVLLAGLAVQAQTKPVPPIPEIMAHARWVYVTSWDGPQFSSRVLPEDRAAVGDVQNALRSWGKYGIVFEPQQADLVIVVQRRPSEDYLAVYDPRFDNSVPLWWTSSRGGLDPQEMPLIKSLQAAVDKASAPKPKAGN